MTDELDLDGLRARIGDGPSDAVLTDLLSEAIASIEARYGTDAGPVTEYLRPFGQWVRLTRPASSITSVKEGTTTLSAGASGYQSYGGDARIVRRLDASSNPTAWTNWVEIVYVPTSEQDDRNRVTVALVKHELNNNPGLTGITVGPWSEQYTQDDKSYAETREAILASLRRPRVGTW